MIVTSVKAQKDYPESGIVKGDIHYTWKVLGKKARRSKEMPEGGVLRSEYVAAKYAEYPRRYPTALLEDVRQLILNGMALWEACIIYELCPDERNEFIRAADRVTTTVLPSPGS